MSLALGVSCSEGAVVATDSLRAYWASDGRFVPRIVSDKLQVSQRFVCAHRGASPPALDPLPRLPDDFAAATNRVFRLFSERTFSAPGTMDRTHELVAAGSRFGEPVQLALLSTYAAPRYAPPFGGILIAGLSENDEPAFSEGWWPPLQPQTLSDCVSTALQLCFEIIRRNLVRIRGRTDIPGACWPIHLAVVEPTRITTQVIEESAYRLPVVNR